MPSGAEYLNLALLITYTKNCNWRLQFVLYVCTRIYFLRFTKNRLPSNFKFKTLISWQESIIAEESPSFCFLHNIALLFGPPPYIFFLFNPYSYTFHSKNIRPFYLSCLFFPIFPKNLIRFISHVWFFVWFSSLLVHLVLTTLSGHQIFFFPKASSLG